MRSAGPGTNLHGGAEATLYRYSFESRVLELIGGAAEALFDSVQPSLLEDLAILREDGTAMLSSITHERDAYLTLTSDEHETMLQKFPGLPEITRPTPKTT